MEMSGQWHALVAVLIGKEGPDEIERGRMDVWGAEVEPVN
jgi:hypothetical protein